MATKGNASLGRPARNPRTLGSAAAYAGCIGLPDPGQGPRFGDGGLERFCQLFNRRADQWLSTRSVECRAFARADREARVSR